MADKLSLEYRQDEQPLRPKILTLTGDACSYRRSFATWDMKRITIRWYGAQFKRVTPSARPRVPIRIKRVLIRIGLGIAPYI